MVGGEMPFLCRSLERAAFAAAVVVSLSFVAELGGSKGVSEAFAQSYGQGIAQGQGGASGRPGTKSKSRGSGANNPSGSAGASGSSSGSSGSSSWGDPLAGSGDANADPELSDFSKETDTALHSLLPGNVSLDVALPGGGSRALDGSAGARIVFSQRLAASVAALVGLEKEAKKNAFGGAVKLQSFLPTSTRAFPYVWTAITAGKNGGDGNEGDDELKAGGGLGFGVEIFLMKELSVSGEVGISSQIMPGAAFRLATGTSQLALHLFVGQ
jgi:hypothetical protein